SPQDQVERIRIGGTLPQAAGRLYIGKADVQGRAHADDDLILPGSHVSDRLVEVVGPELCTSLGGGKLGVHPQSLSKSLHAPAHNIAHVEIPPDLSYVLPFATVGVGSGP